MCQKPGLGMRRGQAPRCRSEPLITVAPALTCRPSMALHAKLLQSCPTLCDPMECSPSGSSVQGILQAVGCHALFQGIFPTQGSNPHLLRLLHWQVDSLQFCTIKPIFKSLVVLSPYGTSVMSRRERFLLSFPWALSSSGSTPGHSVAQS